MGASIRNGTAGVVTLPPSLGSLMVASGGTVLLPFSEAQIMEKLGGVSRFPAGLTITDNVPISPATPSINAVASDYLLSVLDKDLTTPPTPAIGARYIVAAGATGAWAGHDGEVAQGLGSSWSFEEPTAGAITFVEDEALHYAYDGSAWNTLGATSGSAGGGFTASESETSPALSFPIDYNDVTAVDPPAGTTFKTQQEINDFLAANGTSNFKHVMACWDALPTFVNQTIDFNLAYGVHRPRNPEPAPAAWFFGPYLGRPKIIGPRFFLRVQEPSTTAASWAQVVAAQTVLTNNMNASGNPNVVFSGTPFTAGKLKGYYAHFSGSTNPVMIHDNTADTLFFARTGGGTITPGSTTVRVVKPGIIFRNSYNDTSQAKSLAFQSFLPTTAFGMFFNGVTLETFGGSSGMLCQSRMDILQVLIDDAGVKDQFNVTSTSQAFNMDAQNNPTIQSQVWDFAIRSGRLAAVPGGGGGGMLLNGSFGNLLMSFVSAYLDGSGNNPLIVRDAMVRFFGNVICERTSTNSLYCAVVEGNAQNGNNMGRALFRGVSASSGKYPEFRNGLGGIEFIRALAMAWGGTVVFNGLTSATEAAIKAGEDCDLDLSGATLTNGAVANAGRGVDLVGPRSRVKLNASTDVTGTAGGNARVDGITKTFQSIAEVRRVTSQPGSTLAGIVVVEDVEGATTVGNGTLTFTAAGTLLAYTAPGDTIGTAKDVSGLGTFVLRSNNGKWIRVFVAGSLPGADVAQTVVIARGIYRNPGLAQPINEFEKL